MTDIRDRLTLGNVLVAPLLLQEAIDTIDHLRADLERERRWIRQLEACVLNNINEKRGHERKSEQG
jgi:uncharacterized membrane protein